MNHILHSIRNGRILTETQLQQLSELNDDQKILVIRAYNETVRGLSEFIQELLRSLGTHMAPVQEEGEET
jgi:hypothetical protein